MVTVFSEKNRLYLHCNVLECEVFLRKCVLKTCILYWHGYAGYEGAIALLYPPRVRVRATVKLSAVFQPFFHNESSITIGGGGVRKCNSAD